MNNFYRPDCDLRCNITACTCIYGGINYSVFGAIGSTSPEKETSLDKKKKQKKIQQEELKRLKGRRGRYD